MFSHWQQSWNTHRSLCLSTSLFVTISQSGRKPQQDVYKRLCCIIYNIHIVYSHDRLCTLTVVNAFYTHTHSLLCSLWIVVVVLAVQLFEDERLPGLSTHLWPKPLITYWQCAHTKTHAFPFQTFLSISYSFLVHLLAHCIHRQKTNIQMALNMSE